MIYPCIFLKQIIFNLLSKEKVPIFRKGNIMFSNNTIKIIFQHDFFGKTIFSEHLQKNAVFRAVHHTNCVVLLLSYQYKNCCVKYLNYLNPYFWWKNYATFISVKDSKIFKIALKNIKIVSRIRILKYLKNKQDLHEVPVYFWFYDPLDSSLQEIISEKSQNAWSWVRTTTKYNQFKFYYQNG